MKISYKKKKDTLKHLKDDLGIESNIDNDKITVDFASKVLHKLETIKIENEIEFVHGKGKRKSKFQKYFESLEEFIEKQSNYDEYNDIFNGRNSFSKTD